MNKIVTLIAAGFLSSITTAGFFVYSWNGGSQHNSSTRSDILISASLEPDTIAATATISTNTSAPGQASSISHLPADVDALIPLNIDRIVLLDDNSHYFALQQALTRIRFANEQTLSSLADALLAVDQHLLIQRILVRSVFQRWIELNHDSALEYLKQIGLKTGDVWHDGTVYEEAMRAITATKPELVISWLAENKASALSIDQRGQIYLGIAHSDPELALSAYLAQEDYVTHESLLVSILDTWMQISPSDTIDWIDLHAIPAMRLKLLPGLLFTWLELDPDAALQAIVEMPPSSEKPYLLARYAAKIAENDPYNAYHWASNLPEMMSRYAAQNDVLNQWAYDDPDGLIQFLDGQPDSKLRSQHLAITGYSIASALLERDPIEAINWIDQLPVNQRENLQPMAFEQWLHQSPETAVAWIIEHDLQTSNMFSRVAPSIAHSNLELAIQLFPMFTVSTQREMSNSIAYELTRQDFDRAVQWISTLADAESLANAQIGSTYSMLEFDPAQALSLAENMTGSHRSDILSNVVMQVATLDPNLIDNWLESASLSEAERVDLRDQLLDESGLSSYH